MKIRCEFCGCLFVHPDDYSAHMEAFTSDPETHKFQMARLIKSSPQEWRRVRTGEPTGANRPDKLTFKEFSEEGMVALELDEKWKVVRLMSFIPDEIEKDFVWDSRSKKGAVAMPEWYLMANEKAIKERIGDFSPAKVQQIF